MALIAAVVALLACLIGAEPPPPALSPLELSAMTFNIRYDNPADGPDRWEARREQVAALITDRDPDLIGLQEVLHHQLEELKKALPQYAAAGVGRDDGKTRGEYSCILYRASRFELAESGTFWLSQTPETPGSRDWEAACVRICTWARLVDKPTGRGLYIFNTHLDHQSQKARDLGAELIARRIAERSYPALPVILTGDLNAGEENSTTRFLTGRAPRAHLSPATPAPPRTGLVDSFRVKHPDEASVGTFNGFKKDDGRKIDYILVPDGTQVLDAAIDRRSRDGRWPSDHFPVTARILLK
ncbi:MAG: endonuclease/exonuclease/phosphatase family protein [Phycisphaerales bacterium]